VTIELISDLFSNSYYTSTGSKYVSLLSPTEYNIRYRADGYAPRNYFFTLLNNTYTLLNLTLLELGQGENVTVTVQDTLGNNLVGARVKVLKYIVPTNSYRLVDVRQTNFEGQTNIYMQLNTEYYIFIVEYDYDNDGDLDQVLRTDPTYIYSTAVNLKVNLLSSGFNSLFQRTGLYGVIQYDNDSRQASYTFNDGQGTASQGCLYAYKLFLGDRNLVNTSCQAGASGVINITLENVNASFELRGYVTRDAKDYFITQKYVTIGKNFIFTDNTSLFLSALIIVSMFFLGFFAIELGIIMAGFATMVLSFTGLLNLSAGVTVPVFVLSIILAYIIGKNRRGGFA